MGVQLEGKNYLMKLKLIVIFLSLYYLGDSNEINNQGKFHQRKKQKNSHKSTHLVVFHRLTFKFLRIVTWKFTQLCKKIIFNFIFFFITCMLIMIIGAVGWQGWRIGFFINFLHLVWEKKFRKFRNFLNLIDLHPKEIS